MKSFFFLNAICQVPLQNIQKSLKEREGGRWEVEKHQRVRVSCCSSLCCHTCSSLLQPTTATPDYWRSLWTHLPVISLIHPSIWAVRAVTWLMPIWPRVFPAHNLSKASCPCNVRSPCKTSKAIHTQLLCASTASSFHTIQRMHHTPIVFNY